jgi:hypothetical protein
MLVFVLNVASALAALVAAVFWFRSAASPRMTPWAAYVVEPTSPLYQALRARDSRWAALAAGVSALLMAAATLAQALQSRSSGA